MKPPTSILLTFIKEEFHHNLSSFGLWMNHCNLNSAVTCTAPTLSIIKAPCVSSCYDLPQSAIVCIPNLDKVCVEKENIWRVMCTSLRFAHKLHNHSPRNIAVLINVNTTF